MRITLTAIFMTLATHASAFDVNMTPEEIYRLNMEYLVDDLSAGVKAKVSKYAFCNKDGKIVLRRAATLGVNYDWQDYYEIILLPNGKISAEFVNAVDHLSNEDPNQFDLPNYDRCGNEIDDKFGYYSVETIDGTNNVHDLIIKLIADGYKIKNETLLMKYRVDLVSDNNRASVSVTTANSIASQVTPCWVVDLGSEAANVTVTVAMTLDRDGKVEGNSMKLVASEGGSDSAANTAFHAARRAILRCQKDGYRLPVEKYKEWRNVEITFDPSTLHSR